MSSLFSEDAKSEQSQTERNRNEQKRKRRSAMHLSPEKAGFSVSTSQINKKHPGRIELPTSCVLGGRHDH